MRVAGVKIGDAETVELDNGHAVVTFAIDRDDVPIYRDATVLMRPQTGLRDMFFQLDPGPGPPERSPTARSCRWRTPRPTCRSTRFSRRSTRLQAYLRLLLVGGGQGLDGRGRDLGRVLGGWGRSTATWSWSAARPRSAAGTWRVWSPASTLSRAPRAGTRS